MGRESIPPLGQPNPIETLRQQLAHLQGEKTEKDTRKRAKRQQAIAEVADTAVGNKRLSSKTKQGKEFGAGYKKIEDHHQETEREAVGQEATVRSEYQTAVQQLAQLKISISQALEQAQGEERAPFEELLKNAEVQERELETEFTNNLNQARWRREKATSSREEAVERHSRFAKEQETAANNPYPLATEAVIASHKEDRENPNDFSGEKDQIKQEAETLGDEREALDDARENFPKMQEYADGVEREFSAVEEQLKENFRKAEAAIAAYASKFDAKKYEQTIKELREKIVQSRQGMFKRQKTRDAERSQALVGLAAVATETGAVADGLMLDNFYDFNRETGYRFEHGGLSGKYGDLSETAFSLHVNSWRLETWQRFAEKNSKLFGKLAEEISAFKQRIGQIKNRRFELYRLTSELHNEISRKRQAVVDPFYELSRQARIRP